MKKLLYPLFTLLILFTVGCGDDDATDDATDDTNPLVGVWEMTTVSILIETEPFPQTITYNTDANNNETMILAEDGTYSSSGVLDGDSFSNSGSWSSTSNKLTIIEDGETLGIEIELIFDFSISGSTLTLIGSDTYIVFDTEYNMVITITYTKS